MDALLLVDIQNDFLPGGALGVARGDEVIPVANALMPRFACVVATQDWHPAEHRSFASQHPGRRVGEMIELDGLPQTLWPDHCVQGTHGADFAAALDRSRLTHVVRKGVHRDVDSYSGFFDNGRRHATGLDDWLRTRGVDGLVVLGLATDYCVRYTVLDAVRLGYGTTVVVDGVRGVELTSGDGERAIAEMAGAGARLASLVELLAERA